MLIIHNFTSQLWSVSTSTFNYKAALCKESERPRDATRSILMLATPWRHVWRHHAWRRGAHPSTSPARETTSRVWISNGSTNHLSGIPTPENHPPPEATARLLLPTRPNGADPKISQHSRAAHWLVRDGRRGPRGEGDASLARSQCGTARRWDEHCCWRFEQ